MNSFKKPARRTALITGVAGVALLGAVGVGGAAFADAVPTPAASGSASSAPAAPSPGASGGHTGEKGAHAPHIGGEVLTVSGSTITVQDRDGFTRTIVLADGAAVTKDGAASSASAIVKGEHVEATGKVASDGTSLDASAVMIGEPAGRGGHGGPGRGGPERDGRGPQAQDGTQRGEGATPPAAPAPQQSGGTAAPSASAPVQGS